MFSVRSDGEEKKECRGSRGEEEAMHEGRKKKNENSMGARDGG